MKQTLSIVAIIVASVTAGVIISADLGLTTRSEAQQQAARVDPGTMPAVAVPSFADIAERVMPAVVSITTTEVVRGRQAQGMNPFDFFFPDPRRRGDGEDEQEHREMSGGTGFIISPDGYILTNNHVVENATKVEVHYGEENIVEAKIVGRDPATDIAVVKIDVKEQLPTVRLGDSDKIRVGDWALAIGNPLQFENSLTVGVISGKGRSLGINETTNSFENFIQTDAAINFGNSGGPLLNIQGEVIGINTAIRAMAQNLGFATPINVAKQIYPQLKEKGSVTRGYLGIRIGEISQQDREAFSLPSSRGALVQSVEPGGPADKAGIQHGDAVIQIDNVEIKRNRDLIDYVSSLAPGTSVKVTLVRNGERKTLTAKTGVRPDTAEGTESREDNDPAPARSKLGVSLQELTPAVRQMYGLDDEVRGLLVTNVREVSPAGEQGLQQGDVITEVNGKPVGSIADFSATVDKAKSGQYLRLYVTRGSRTGRTNSFFVVIRVP
jgi:serine protease Do